MLTITPSSWGSLEASGRTQTFCQWITSLLGQCLTNHMRWTLLPWVVWFRMLKLPMFTSTTTNLTIASIFGLTPEKDSGKIALIDGLPSQLILSSIPSTIFLFLILQGRIPGCLPTSHLAHIALVSILGGGWRIFYTLMIPDANLITKSSYYIFYPHLLVLHCSISKKKNV